MNKKGKQKTKRAGATTPTVDDMKARYLAHLDELKQDTNLRDQILESAAEVVNANPRGTRLHISSFYPTYLRTPNVSERVKTLERLPVRLAAVHDKEGHFEVQFQDRKGKDCYKHLLRQMSHFYTTLQGSTLQKPNVVPGEIVAALVILPRNATTTRRVKIVEERINPFNVKEKTKEWIGIGIDDLHRYRIVTPFSLIEDFYCHPVQACHFKALNFKHLYPRGIFDEFFRHREDFNEVMIELTYRVLCSRVRDKDNFSVTNIKWRRKNNNPVLTGTLRPRRCLRSFQPQFVEAFCEYFTPRLPEIGMEEVGEVTHIEMNGKISICSESSLFRPINDIINAGDLLQRFAFPQTKQDTEDLTKKICTHGFVSFLVYDDDDDIRRLHRAKLEGINSKNQNIQVKLLDKAKKIFYTDYRNIVCPMSSPNVHQLLAVLPPQVMTYHIAGATFLSHDEMINLLGKTIRFKVTRIPSVLWKDPEIEILN